MHTVWSKVAQAKATCRCASCTVKTSVTRHAGTAASKRPTRYFTTSTLLYSGVFAVAATTDALFKEKRRKQWDEAIAQAKEGVEQVRTRLEGMEDNEFYQQAGVRQQGPKDALSDYLDELEAAYKDARDAPDGAAWPANSGHGYVQGNFAPQSVWASPQFQTLHKARRWTTKKLRLTELAMDRLTLKVMLRLHDEGVLTEESADRYTGMFKELVRSSRPRLEQLLMSVENGIRDVKAMDVRSESSAFDEIPRVLSHYTQDEQYRYLDVAASTERTVARAFHQHCPTQISTTQLALDTLHSLVTSSAPPTLGSFNQIVDGYSRLGMDPKFTQYAIGAMRTSHIRMDENSLVAILEHNIRNNDYQRFCKFVELMQGEHGGLSLASPDVWITEKSQGRLVPVMRHGKQKIVQKPVANPIVLSTLVQGVMHFDGFEAALEVCQSMGQDGWGLSMKGLTPLLRECARRRDWESGWAVWTQIKRVQAQSGHSGRAELIQSWTYATMLRLCLMCHKQAEFTQILDEAAREANLAQTPLLNQVRRLDLSRDEQSTTVTMSFSRQRQRTQKFPVRMIPRERLHWRKAHEITEVPEHALTQTEEHIVESASSLESAAEDTAALTRGEVMAETTSSKDNSSVPDKDVVSSSSAAPEQVSLAASSALDKQIARIEESRAYGKKPQGSPSYRSRVEGELQRDQLMGSGLTSRGLNEWELVERPMSLFERIDERMFA